MVTRISVVTPLHAAGNAYIEEAHRSLRHSGLDHFEWLILENHGGLVPERVRGDKRVVVREAPDSLSGVGALKQYACGLAKGALLVELDADDELTPGALSRVARAFEKGADFVYSDFAEFRNEDGVRRSRWDGYPYSSAYGWQSYGASMGHTKPGKGRVYEAMCAPPATAHNLRLVDWSPNHVRAWRRETYERVGGHDPSLAVADDHDLCVRMYLAGARFHHITECLYLYRVHGDNTVATRNAEIRAGTWRNYERYIWALAQKWCKDNGLRQVDLCGAHDAPAGFEVLDQAVAPHPDLDARWPLRDDSVGVLRAYDAVEHLRDPVHTMNEAYRVLAPGGFFFVHVPASNGLGAFCDPTHRSYWNRLSFRYYTDRAFARYIPAFKGRFQVGRVLEWFPSEWHRRENVPYVSAELFALKDGFRPMGEVRI